MEKARPTMSSAFKGWRMRDRQAIQFGEGGGKQKRLIAAMAAAPRSRTCAASARPNLSATLQDLEPAIFLHRRMGVVKQRHAAVGRDDPVQHGQGRRHGPSSERRGPIATRRNGPISALKSHELACTKRHRKPRPSRPLPPPPAFPARDPWRSPPSPARAKGRASMPVPQPRSSTAIARLKPHQARPPARSAAADSPAGSAHKWPRHSENAVVHGDDCLHRHSEARVIGNLLDFALLVMRLILSSAISIFEWFHGQYRPGRRRQEYSGLGQHAAGAGRLSCAHLLGWRRGPDRA